MTSCCGLLSPNMFLYEQMYYFYEQLFVFSGSLRQKNELKHPKFCSTEELQGAVITLNGASKTLFILFI